MVVKYLELKKKMFAMLAQLHSVTDLLLVFR